MLHWECVLRLVLRYPDCLIEMISKYSLNLFRWNKLLYDKNSIDIKPHEIGYLEYPLKFINDYSVEYPDNCGFWRAIWFDQPIVLNYKNNNDINKFNDKDRSKIKFVNENNNENSNNNNNNNSNGSNDNNDKLNLKSVIRYEMLIEELPYGFPAYDLQFGFLTPKMIEQKQFAKLWYIDSGGVSKWMEGEVNHHTLKIEKSDIIGFEYEIYKRKCNIFINRKKINAYFQNLPNIFYPAICSVNHAKVTINQNW